MKKLSLSFLLLLCPLALNAAYTFKNGKLIKSEEVATMSVQEHYSAAMDAYQKQYWEEAIRQAVIVVKNFPDTPFARESFFYLGMSYFNLNEFEYANRFLTSYLKKQATPKFFEEVIQCKFKIADEYHHGAKKHVLGWETLPRWVSAREEAISIYDEVITALPHHDLAAHSLFGKAELLLKEEDYKGSIDTYQTLIRRFPKHPLAAESYIGIERAYLIESQEEYPDQDFLDLAEINLRKFRNDLPGEDKVAVAEKMFLEMKEVYASDLYDTGRFYERTKKPNAAYIYYTRILAKYPGTRVSELATKRISKLNVAPLSSLPATKEEQEPNQVQQPVEKAQPPSILNLPVKPGHVVDATEEQRSLDVNIE